MSVPPKAPPVYKPKMTQVAAPPVFRAQTQHAQAKQASPLPRSTPPVFRPAVPAPHRQPLSGMVNGFKASSIQRYCRNPHCTNPDCTDERNHGHDRVYPLRGRTVYTTDVGTGGGGVHRGTGTTSDTRESVNTRTPPVSYRLTYSGDTTSGSTELQNPPSHSGRWDAGHIVGAQHGGLGHDPASVFPQNAQYNRGNSYNGTRTFDDWRRHENNINREARNGGVRQTVTLFDAPRITFYNCTQCGRLRGPAPCSCGAL